MERKKRQFITMMISFLIIVVIGTIAIFIAMKSQKSVRDTFVECIQEGANAEWCYDNIK